MNDWQMIFPDGLDGKGEKDVKIATPVKPTVVFPDGLDGKGEKKQEKQEAKK